MVTVIVAPRCTFICSPTLTHYISTISRSELISIKTPTEAFAQVLCNHRIGKASVTDLRFVGTVFAVLDTSAGLCVCALMEIMARL